MPREIADSDDEIEIAPPPRSSNNIAQKEDVPPSTAERDPMLNLDFDTFLSPTQRISSYDGTSNEVPSPNVLDSSTDRFLNEVAPVRASSSIAPSESHVDAGCGEVNMSGKTSKKEKTSKKRSRTQHDDGDSLRDNARKRTKTYTGSTSGGMSSAQMDFQNMIDGSDDHGSAQQEHGEANNYAGTVDPADMVSIEERTQYTEPLDLSLGLSTSNEDRPSGHAENDDIGNVPMPSYTPHQACTPQTSFFGANLQGGTTSRSSIGNYQSFCIDPSNLKVDFNKINPFGSATQLSLDGDADVEETRALASVFRRSVSAMADNSHESTVHPDMLLNNMQEMQTSPEKGGSSMNAPEQLIAEEEPPQGSPSFSPITNADDDNPNLDTIIAQQDFDELTLPEQQQAEAVEEPVKPPPKKRGRKPKQKKTDQSAANENGLDELQMDENHVPRAIRAGTVDSISNVSEISQATTSSKTGRKGRPKKAGMAPPEVLSKKLPSSDLGLDNKAVIGLSPERYVPRPSRRRGRAEPEPTPDNLAAQQEEPSQHDPSQEAVEKETPAKGKKGRKTKVKRAKTSAPHLSKSTDFLDEDEKEEAQEVMFVDERPARVKLQPLPEFSPDRKLKKEEIAGVPAEAEDDDEEVVQAGKRAKITVDIPVLGKSDDHEELPPPVPEPKKRGRKKKKVEEETVVQPQEEEEEQQIEERPALAEKDTNMSRKKAKNSKSKVLDDEEEADKENDTTDTTGVVPEKASTPTKSVSTPASKTLQSPLKPPASTTPVFNARARIGLSKRHSIPSLLRKVDRNKEPRKAIERKEKPLNKKEKEEREQERVAREEAEAEGREYVPLHSLRGKDGRLVEWDF